MADASGVGMVIHKDAIVVRPEVRAICDYFGMDPYAAISEGTLLITCRPDKAGAITDRLDAVGIEAASVGEVVPRGQGVHIVTGGKKRVLEHPHIDPFWDAFAAALSNLGA